VGFEMFSTTHLSVIILLFVLIVGLYVLGRTHMGDSAAATWGERIFACSLIVFDMGYHIWLIGTDRWQFSNSLPLELCSISLWVTVVLLLSGNRKLIDWVFFAGIGGALQAYFTPVLDMDFPHFRFFHFFYTHAGIILTALYFVWMKGYRPTFKGVLRTMLYLNGLLPLILFINYLTNGNYMFLSEKPDSGSLLDILGPYPWYIVSLEAVTFFIFTILWLLFRNWKSKTTLIR
jgi:hypothetical integral membrane protein (TIGR02206 family)